jgi:predicted MPP superfamily phosphohydrolase
MGMTDESKAAERLDRRKLLKRAGLGALAALGVGTVYPMLEARWCGLSRRLVALPKLPPSFRGMTVALLTDLHHGPFVPLAYIRHVVDLTNSLKPDLILLVGDYVSVNARYIAPAANEVRRLEAPLGRFAVLGNHDHWESTVESKAQLDRAGIELVDNRGSWLRRGSDRLRICGVGDLWTDDQDLMSALGDADEDDAVILLSHNPDYAESVDDSRISLMLSGHTHGGQVIVPGLGAPFCPSKFGAKYLGGLVQGPACPVFVSRGVGTTGPPVRFLCRPEVALLTLT